MAGDRDDVTQDDVDGIVAATLDGLADRGVDVDALMRSLGPSLEVQVASARERNRRAVARERSGGR